MPKKLNLKYGCNPNQKNASICTKDCSNLPIEILNGSPGYINFLDALNAWQLVKELKIATKLPAAASFKHVSPAGAAVYSKISDVLKKSYFVDDINLSPQAVAYAKARGADRLSSYGDFIALSDNCDKLTANLIKREVSDGIIAPSYDSDALEILKSKRSGRYNIIRIDENYIPDNVECREVFGLTFEQPRNDVVINEELLKNIVTKSKSLSKSAKLDLILSMITLKYTQSNSVCLSKDGQVIGVGAGQQSRVHCTRLACNKADNWYLRQHIKVQSLKFKENVSRPEKDNAIDAYISDRQDELLNDSVWPNIFECKPEVFTNEEKRMYLKTMSGISVGSDAFFPFSDNIERLNFSGVKYIAQPGGSIRDKDVISACDSFGMTMMFTGVRLFHH